MNAIEDFEAAMQDEQQAPVQHEPHQFKAANAPVTDSLALCSVCGELAHWCRLMYKPRS